MRLFFIICAHCFGTQAALADINLSSGDSITHFGERITCQSGGSYSLIPGGYRQVGDETCFFGVIVRDASPDFVRLQKDASVFNLSCTGNICRGDGGTVLNVSSARSFTVGGGFPFSGSFVKCQ